MNFNSHHAFLITGSKSDAETLLSDLKIQHTEQQDAEFSFVYEKNLTIDTAREIKDMIATTTSKPIWYIVVSAYSVGHEAQNALLKSLEETPLSKKLVFIIESVQSLLPTFISRFAKVDYVSENKDQEKKQKITTFSITALLKEAEKICKEIKDEESTKKAASDFLDALIIHKKSDIDKIKKLLYFKSCIGKPSASVKQLLESAVAIVC